MNMKMISTRISSSKKPLLCSTCTCLVIVVLFVISLGAPQYSIAVAAAAAAGGFRRNLEHHGGGDHEDGSQPQPQPQPQPTLPPNEITTNIPPPSFEPDDVAIPTHAVTATIVSETNSNMNEEEDIPGVAMEAGVFTILLAALSATNLVGALSAPNGPFTVFAPTDDAFAALPNGLVECLLEEKNIPLLSNILLYHVVASSGPVLSSTDLMNMNGMNIPTLLQGEELTVAFSNGDVKINDATVIFPDVLASNGVLHIIDQVLVPSNIDVGAFLHTCNAGDNGSNGHGSRSSLSSDNDSSPPPSLFDIPTTAMNGGIFSTLVAALSVTDLVDALSEPNGPYTVFAPTDDAFAALPEGLLVCLLEEENVPILSNILFYHVAPGQTLVSTDFVNGMNIATLFERQNVMVTLHNNNYNNNGDVVKINDATVLFPDVRASNGMIHIIDQVLIPPSIDVAAFLASSCGSSSSRYSSDDDNHNNKYEYSSSSSSSSLVVPEPIISKYDTTGTDPYRQQTTTGTTTSYRQQQPTMYPTGPDPYQNQHQHEIYSDSSTTTSRTNDPYRQQQQPPTMYPTGTDPYKQEIYYDSSKYYDYSTTTIMNRYQYHYPPLPRREYKVPPPPPTLHPTQVPPTDYPTCSPTPRPTPTPTRNPTPDPTPRPTSLPTPYPTPLPTFYPTPLPTPYPTLYPYNNMDTYYDYPPPPPPSPITYQYAPLPRREVPLPTPYAQYPTPYPQPINYPNEPYYPPNTNPPYQQPYYPEPAH